MHQLVLNQLVTMALIGLSGFVFAKITKVNEKEQKFLSKFLLYFVNVCLIINSFDIEYSKDKMTRFIFVFIIAFIVHAVLIAVAFVFTRSRTPEGRDYNNIDQLTMIFTNCGFIGIPLIRGIFGDGGVFYLMGYLTVFNITVWTYGLYIMSGKISVKKIITNPVIDAAIAGLLLFVMPFTLPEFISRPLTMIADCNTAIAMVLIGILFADFHFQKKYAYRVLKTTFFRLVVCPLFALLILVLIWTVHPGITDLRTILFVVLICASCPAATSVPSLACLFDKDAAYASVLVSVTSLLCIFTVPTFVALAEQFIK